MIYRLLLDLALTVRSTPVLSFAVCFSRRQKENLRHKEQLSLFAHR